MCMPYMPVACVYGTLTFIVSHFSIFFRFVTHQQHRHTLSLSISLFGSHTFPISEHIRICNRFVWLAEVQQMFFFAYFPDLIWDVGCALCSLCMRMFSISFISLFLRIHNSFFSHSLLPTNKHQRSYGAVVHCTLWSWSIFLGGKNKFWKHFRNSAASSYVLFARMEPL